ncbi:peptidylprolyl isomerase [Corynebacterium sp. YSMAA1_1_F7]|uniref:peptidylprolyl isomerase n=1 Tax=Corynebacterium sp. YSMAA1_1_F7 TaxID=3383590 RepID=UPI0038D25813
MSEKNYPNEAKRDEALKELEKALKSRERKAKIAPLGVVAATLAVLVVIVGGIWFATTYTSDEGEDQVAESEEQTTEPEVEAVAMPDGPAKPYGDTVKCEYKKDPQGKLSEAGLPNGKDVTAKGTQKVTLTMNGKKVGLKLANDKSPCSTNSFAHLVEKKFYDSTKCHRSVKSDSMTILQCGDPEGSGAGGPGYSFPDEFPTNGVEEDKAETPVNYKRGTLAMANSGPDTNGSQFFLVTGDTTLPPKYNVFGTIDEDGLKVLDELLEKAPEGDAAPTEDINIESAVLG